MNQVDTPFSWPIRVYYEDTDAGGIVYHAQYLHFLERARTEWLRQLGFNQVELKAQNILFVIRDMNIKWQMPAKLDDELIVVIEQVQVKKASFTMQQVIYKNHQVLVKADVTIACLQVESMKPQPLPEAVRIAAST
ncbi:tol-pal system-associated acyl-CoA thioesterase [Bermanella marisrubri]|uniref:FcbC protein n=1 Tax=Bermanella marisrubri TaxID=207949 RepID=Q1N0T6_9GAMM|nr:tol-pal system-associated acyl-CoA thioesterase [Bermanella marisrubri]EAT11747.1 FcbC protein [Oceanobacter sp. RED65] [Bermanella marisrubri]QIZ83784.1 tol-pal system-associated acyl-CoA thioesterase [Bermanella marisrubri]